MSTNKIEQILDEGQVIRGDSFDVFALQGTERAETLDWKPSPGSRLWNWLDAGNQFIALKVGRLVRFTALGFEKVCAPPKLLAGVEEDGENRIWTQGGYVFSVGKDDKGHIFTALMGTPQGGSAAKAWGLHPTTKTGRGRTFLEAMEDAFDTRDPPDN